MKKTWLLLAKKINYQPIFLELLQVRLSDTREQLLAIASEGFYRPNIFPWFQDQWIWNWCISILTSWLLPTATD